MLARFPRYGQDTEAGAGVGADREVQWAVVLPHCLVVPGERPGRAAPAPGHPPGNCLIYSEIFHCPRHVILTTQIGAEQVHEHPVSSFPIPYFILVSWKDKSKKG